VHGKAARLANAALDDGAGASAARRFCGGSDGAACTQRTVAAVIAASGAAADAARHDRRQCQRTPQRMKQQQLQMHQRQIQTEKRTERKKLLEAGSHLASESLYQTDWNFY